MFDYHHIRQDFTSNEVTHGWALKLKPSIMITGFSLVKSWLIYDVTSGAFSAFHLNVMSTSHLPLQRFVPPIVKCVKPRSFPHSWSFTL